MTRSFRLSMSDLADDIEVQLRHQGLTLGSRSNADRVQRWANAISSLGIQGLLTETERDRARKRLLKEIRPLVRPLPAQSMPLPTTEEFTS